MDERLVRVVTVNIYRNWHESFQTFDYITETGKFGAVERQAARIVGAVMMWAIAGGSGTRVASLLLRHADVQLVLLVCCGICARTAGDALCSRPCR